MPFYDYTCSSCDHVFERHLSMSNSELPLSDPCPSCGVSGSVRQCLGLTPIAYLSDKGFAKKIPSDFRNLLSMMKKANPDGYIKDR